MRGLDWNKGWREFWRGPDAALLVAGGEGERLAARVRVTVVALLLITPIYKIIEYPDNPVFLWGLVVTGVAMVFALAIHLYLRWRPYRAWVGFLSSLLDNSFVTSALALFVFVGSPLIAANSKVTFDIYFLSIVAMSLRQDRRICLVIGTLTVLQYAALIEFITHAYDVYAPELQDPSVGYFSGVDQFTRVVFLAAAVVISYAIVRRSERLLYRSVRDPMTGLFNRGYFDTLFDFEIERARRYGRRFALVIFDADHFKRINDSHGHPTGDAVLRALARALRLGVRQSDVVVRYGGEEFVLLLHDSDATPAYDKADTLRQMVAKLLLKPPGLRHNIKLTVSAGVAQYPEDGTTARALMTTADQRLLRAKQSGRNRVVAS
ncbi:MAG TPA: GGDEF domain-containing protein [Gammaproteobacteria bacterium]|jgi:diguanylate cyclase (GGDEF)-like protein|nr:GGDEF domain-containing protein [Gammaproteobacteria bacterium]